MLSNLLLLLLNSRGVATAKPVIPGEHDYNKGSPLLGGGETVTGHVPTTVSSSDAISATSAGRSLQSGESVLSGQTVTLTDMLPRFPRCEAAVVVGQGTFGGGFPCPAGVATPLKPPRSERTASLLSTPLSHDVTIIVASASVYMVLLHARSSPCPSSFEALRRPTTSAQICFDHSRPRPCADRASRARTDGGLS